MEGLEKNTTQKLDGVSCKVYNNEYKKNMMVDLQETIQ
jgi:hypothetical protein